MARLFCFWLLAIVAPPQARETLEPMSRTLLFKLVLALTAGATSGCVSYWRGQEIDAELKALQGQIEQGNDSSRKAREKSGRDLAALEGRIAELERGFKTAIEGLQTGSANNMVVIEQMATEMNQIKGRFEELKHKLDAEANTMALAGVPVNAAGAPPLPQDAVDLYKYGWGKRNENDCNEAVRAFAEFARLFPNNDKADNALFLVAECRFQAKANSQSISALRTIMQKYPKGDKVDDALELMHDNFAAMGQCKDGMPFLETLIADYPKSTRVKAAQKKLADAKKSCR